MQFVVSLRVFYFNHKHRFWGTQKFSPVLFCRFQLYIFHEFQFYNWMSTFRIPTVIFNIYPSNEIDDIREIIQKWQQLLSSNFRTCLILTSFSWDFLLNLKCCFNLADFSDHSSIVASQNNIVNIAAICRTYTQEFKLDTVKQHYINEKNISNISSQFIVDRKNVLK